MKVVAASVFVGLMSGTSLDGADGVAVRFADSKPLRFEVLGHHHRPFPTALRQEFLALNTAGPNELERMALAGNALANLYSEVVYGLLREASFTAEDVIAIGAHGQTVRHRPGELDGIGLTLQVNNPALLAELTGLNVIADFRSRDLAAGGQAAPLVPAFHHALFALENESLGVLNLGGISNLTLLRPGAPVLGFDCGPANLLMDLWCEQHSGQPYDANGEWAATGKPVLALLQRLRSDAFFSLPPPKSTGRDLFHIGWLKAALRGVPNLQPEDVQATLCELTATTCADALLRHAPNARRLLVCGGGALNAHLMSRLSAALPRVAVQSTDAVDLPPMHVEAVAFAWLARAFVQREPGNLPSVTGAAGERILGALYPAG